MGSLSNLELCEAVGCAGEGQQQKPGVGMGRDVCPRAGGVQDVCPLLISLIKPRVSAFRCCLCCCAALWSWWHLGGVGTRVCCGSGVGVWAPGCGAAPTCSAAPTPLCSAELGSVRSSSEPGGAWTTCPASPLQLQQKGSTWAGAARSRGAALLSGSHGLRTELPMETLHAGRRGAWPCPAPRVPHSPVIPVSLCSPALHSPYALQSPHAWRGGEDEGQGKGCAPLGGRHGSAPSTVGQP